MTPPLWTHQQNDIERYLRDGSLFNTSDPGTGKTRTVIEVIRQRKLPTLIFAPKSILQCAWGNDIETFAPELSYNIATASDRAAMMSTDSLIKITNIDALLWLKENPRYMRQFEGGMLVIDESTSVKNPQSRRSKAAMHFRPMFEYATCMSGTPSPQGVIDLWSQMYLVDQGQRLGKSFSRFRNFAYMPVRKGAFLEWVEKQGATDMVAGLIADITIRNKREDCLDLPPNQVIRYNTTLSTKHLKQYEILKKNALLELQTGEITAIHAGVLLQKLLQIATGAVYDTEGNYHVVDDARYDLIMDLVEERPHSVVVFNWRHQREQLVEAAKKRKIPCDYIDGSVTSAARRAEIVAKYQAGDYQTLFIHPQSAGHGITLTKGHATIWASPTYNAEWFEQANARIYRGGQDKETETILISATGTAEPLVYQALQEKCGNMKDLLATFI